MNSITTLTDLANIIELAVAPVFLLAGIAGFLNVMSGRLGRIVDRARVLERRVSALDAAKEAVVPRAELMTIWRRVRIINWSIGFCTMAGLLVCVLVVSLFAGGFLSLAIDGLIVGLFVLSMLLLIFSLSLFLKEVQLATRTMRIGGESQVEERLP